MPGNLNRCCHHTGTRAPHVEQHNHWSFEKPGASRELRHAAVVNSGGSCDAVSPITNTSKDRLFFAHEQPVFAWMRRSFPFSSHRAFRHAACHHHHYATD